MAAADASFLREHVLAEGRLVQKGENYTYREKVFSGLRNDTYRCLDMNIEAGLDDPSRMPMFVFDAMCALPVDLQGVTLYTKDMQSDVQWEHNVGNLILYGNIRIVLHGETGDCLLGGTPWLEFSFVGDVGNRSFFVKDEAFKELLLLAGAEMVRATKEHQEYRARREAESENEE